MNNTLYISDLDGTLLNSKAELSEKTVNTINQFIGRGLLFTYATARSFTSAGKIMHRLNIKIPIATYNGAFLVSPGNGEIIESCIMDTAKIEPIIEAIKMSRIYPLVYSLIEGKEKVSWVKGKENAGLTNYLAVRKGDSRLRPVISYDELFTGEIFYITIIGDRDEILLHRRLFEGNNHIYYHIQEDTYNKGEFWLEAFRFDATKEFAVRKLKRITNVSEAVCFGDNINDLPMFKASDRCYAVANACQSLKEAATEIINSNDEDGVAAWLDKMEGSV